MNIPASKPPEHRAVIPRRRIRKLACTALAAVVAVVMGTATPALAATVHEYWTANSTIFHKGNNVNANVIGIVSDAGADDGKALKMQLNAFPAANPDQGVQIDSNRTNYQYGTYGSRIKMANCAGQNRPGVVTGTFTYATNHADVNGNGLPDNDEIDIEVLCAQPYVLWLTIWTDYRDSDAAARKISRAINMRTGAVLYNCYVFRLGDNCQPAVAGENNPARVTAVPNYDSGTQFRSYFFDWQPNRVTFWGYDNTGAKNVLWDYTGPSSRIPKKPGMFMQNVWHTNNWDPLDGPAHNQPTANRRDQMLIRVHATVTSAECGMRRGEPRWGTDHPRPAPPPVPASACSGWSSPGTSRPSGRRSPVPDRRPGLRVHRLHRRSQHQYKCLS